MAIDPRRVMETFFGEFPARNGPGSVGSQSEVRNMTDHQTSPAQALREARHALEVELLQLLRKFEGENDVEVESIRITRHAVIVNGQREGAPIEWVPVELDL